MRNTFILTAMLAGALSIVGCGDKEIDTADSATTGGTEMTTTRGTDSTTTADTETATDPTTTTGDPTTTTGSITDDPFLVPPDSASLDECTTWEENCPEGQKCMPYSNDGGSAWNDLKCVDITGEGKPGEPCTVEGSPVSAMDDCQLHAMCWDVDPETNEGVCTAFCSGNGESPTCEPKNTFCFLSGGGVLSLCLPTCNPLIQDCDDGTACYPAYNTFTCAPVALPPEEGLDGDPCEYLNACQPGLMCINSEVYPNGCGGSGGCCSRYCDLSDPECLTPGTECIPIYENPTPEQENYGVCAVPE